jgi:hypothetical protein
VEDLDVEERRPLARRELHELSVQRLPLSRRAEDPRIDRLAALAEHVEARAVVRPRMRQEDILCGRLGRGRPGRRRVGWGARGHRSMMAPDGRSREQA